MVRLTAMERIEVMKYMTELQEKLLKKYKDKFGIDLSECVHRTVDRAEMLDLYVNSYLFWEEESPKVDDERKLKPYALARQYICSYYIQDIVESSIENKIYDQVIDKIDEIKGTGRKENKNIE